MIRGKASILRFALVAVLLAATALFLQARAQREKLPARQTLDAFPDRVGDWNGKKLPIPPNFLEVLGPGDFLTQIYARSASEPWIDFYVAYFPSQRTGDTIHSPKNCLPGSGWMPVESSHMPLALPGHAPISVNRYIIAKGSDRQLVLYWYQAHGRFVASEYWAKFYLVLDAIRMNRTDGALVRIVTPIPSGEDARIAEARATAFAQQIFPKLPAYIPE